MTADATNQRSAPHAAHQESSAQVRGWTLAVVSVTTFMLLLDVTVVNVGLPSLRAALNASFAQQQWVIAAYTLTMAAFLLPSGSLADRNGRKRVFTLGLGVFTLSSLGAGLAVDAWMLNVARGVQGVGAAMLFSVGLALLGQEFRGAKARGTAFGVWGAVGGLAFAFGPLIGGSLTASLGWRWIFLVNVPIGVLVLLPALRQLREVRDPHARGVDTSGMAVFAGSLALVLFALMAGNSMGWDCPPILFAFGFGAVGLAVFTAIEHHKGPAAMLDLDLFRIRSFNGVAWGTFCNNAASLASVFLLISYLQNVLGYSAWQTGLRFMPLTLTLFAVALLTGRWGTRVSPGVLLGAAISLIAVGLGLITLVKPDSSWTALLPGLLVTGMGMGMFNPPRAAVTVGVVGPARAGMASGVGQTFQQAGVAIGVAGFGALFQSCVVSAFTASEAGRQLGGRAQEVAHEVATGALADVGSLVPAASLEAVQAAARVAYVESLSEVVRLCALLAALGAVLVFTLVRRGDLHESALDRP